MHYGNGKEQEIEDKFPSQDRVMAGTNAFLNKALERNLKPISDKCLCCLQIILDGFILGSDPNQFRKVLHEYGDLAIIKNNSYNVIFSG